MNSSISQFQGQRIDEGLSTRHTSMGTDRMALGAEAESAVCAYFRSLGARILDRNWRRPWGELDIVALTPDRTVHFVEVKASRRSVVGFAPELRADWRKMARVRRTARTWLAASRCGSDTGWQLDVASVIMGPTGPEVEVFWNI